MATIFISYRRKPSASLANYIELALRPTPISVFLDVKEEFGAGRFPKRLEKAIADCQIVVSLLADTTLDSAWVQKELSLAHQFKKAIIPVFQESFGAPSEDKQNETIKNLLTYDAVYFFDIKNVYIEPAMDTLKNRILRTQGVAPITAPANNTPVNAGGYAMDAMMPPVCVPKTEALAQPMGKLEIRILGDLSQFHEPTFIGAISGMVGVRPDEIKVLYTKPGSIVVGLQMPYAAALHLYYGFTGQWHILQAQTRLPTMPPQSMPRPRRLGNRLPARIMGATGLLTMGLVGGVVFSQVTGDDCDCRTTTVANGITPSSILVEDDEPASENNPRSPLGRVSPTPSETNTPSPTSTPSVTPTNPAGLTGSSLGVMAEPITVRHLTSRTNTIENYTVLDHPDLNGNPDAILIVTEGGGSGSPVGVWYDGTNWTIYNENLAAMPARVSFTVLVVEPSDNAFVVYASEGNIKGEAVFLDHSGLYDNPDAIILFTPVFYGIYNPYYTALQYDDSGGTWFIYNIDGSFMQPGVAFNVYIAP